MLYKESTMMNAVHNIELITAGSPEAIVFEINIQQLI